MKNRIWTLAAALTLTAPLALLSAGCLEVEPEDELGAVEDAMAAPGQQSCPQYEEELETDTDSGGGCGQVVSGGSKQAAAQPLSKSAPPAPGGGNRCPLPQGSSVVHGDLNTAEQVQCYVHTQNMCITASAYANAALEGSGAAAGSVASACQGMTGTALVSCLIDSARSQLTSPPAVCRNYAYLVDRACAQMGLDCEFQAGPKHAWVVLKQNPGCDYVIDAYNNVAYCRP